MNGKAVFQGGNAQSLDNIAGQPIAEYTHSKSGTVHKLEGPVNAKNIVFKATGDYNDGDTWTLNNTPVTVTYNGGEELLPTAVLVGDAVQAVVIGNQLRLILQKPTPQESITDNGIFSNPVNQRAKKEYTSTGYTIDRWRLDNLINMKVKDDHILFTGEQNRDYCNFVQIAKSKESVEGKQVTFSLLGEGYFNLILGINGTHLSNPIEFNNISKTLITYTFSISENLTDDVFVIIQSLHIVDKAAKVYATKLELGNRFTGWPAWNRETEQAKCQKYQLLTTENGSMHIRAASLSANNIFFDLPTPVTMRTTPVLADPAVFAVRRFGSIEAESGFTFSALAHTGCVRIEASKKAHGLTDATLIVGKTILDANL